jgi:hypothetical protein
MVITDVEKDLQCRSDERWKWVRGLIPDEPTPASLRLGKTITVLWNIFSVVAIVVFVLLFLAICVGGCVAFIHWEME